MRDTYRPHHTTMFARSAVSWSLHKTCRQDQGKQVDLNDVKSSWMLLTVFYRALLSSIGKGGIVICRGFHPMAGPFPVLEASLNRPRAQLR